jgi:hypothetical protein
VRLAEPFVVLPEVQAAFLQRLPQSFGNPLPIGVCTARLVP